MNKVKINLTDICFKHDVGMVNKKLSKFIEWDRDRTNPENYDAYTHRFVFHANPENSLLFLWESEGMYGPDFIQHVRSCSNGYKYIFTSWSSLLDLPNAKFIPSGGIWLDEQDCQIYPKTKSCSLVTSSKKMTHLHVIRYQLSQENLPIDVFGLQKYAEPLDYLKDYRFSVVIENFIDEFYFTEKILNCFACGVIPIYIGAKQISKFFNEDGIIISSPDKIRDDIATVNFKGKEIYKEKESAIKDNFSRVKEFDCIEDYFYRNYHGILDFPKV